MTAVTHTVHSAPRNKGAKIAMIVLLSLLAGYTIAVFSISIVDCFAFMFESNNTRLSVPLIMNIVVVGIFKIYIVFSIVMHANKSSPRWVTVFSDLVGLGTFTFVILVLAIASLVLALKPPTPSSSRYYPRNQGYSGELGSYLAFGLVGFSLVIMLFEAVYTAIHGRGRGWHLRFATLVRAEDVELTEGGRTESTRVSKDAEGDTSPELGFV